MFILLSVMMIFDLLRKKICFLMVKVTSLIVVMGLMNVLVSLLCLGIWYSKIAQYCISCSSRLLGLLPSSKNRHSNLVHWVKLLVCVNWKTRTLPRRLDVICILNRNRIFLKTHQQYWHQNNNSLLCQCFHSILKVTLKDLTITYHKLLMILTVIRDVWEH